MQILIGEQKAISKGEAWFRPSGVGSERLVGGGSAAPGEGAHIKRRRPPQALRHAAGGFYRIQFLCTFI